MTDELDLLTRARDRLIELVAESEPIDPAPWRGRMYVHGDANIYQSEGEPVAAGSEVAFNVGTAGLIVALRGCVPYLIERLDWAIRICHQPHRTCPAELNLARVILGETEGQNNEQ